MNGTGATLGFLAGLSVACAARGSRARSSDGDVVDAATVRAAMYGASRKHAGTGRDARLAERQVPDFDQLVWTLEDVRPSDDRLCQVSGCNERDVAVYARRMERGEVPPPVVLVLRDERRGVSESGGFECVDGSHRVEAARRADLPTIPAYVGRPAKRRTRGSRASIGSNEHLDYVLLPRGKTAQVGAESGKTPRDGIARWESPHGSVRYVRIVRGEPVAAIQVVIRGRSGGAHVAVAFTRKDQRRRGYGRELLAAIRRDYPDLTFSEDRSDDGRAFVQAEEARRAPRVPEGRGSRAKRPWAYHVTYADCLASIARDGLLPQEDTPEAWGNPSGVYLVTRLGNYGGPKPDEPAWLRFPWPERVLGVSSGKPVTYANVGRLGEARTGPVAPDHLEILVDPDGTPGRYEEDGATWTLLQTYVAGHKGSRGREPGSLAHAYLPLAAIDHHVPTMQRLGVSEVARSPRGFLAAYRAVGGDASALSPTWRAKREGFIARHMAQVRERSESLVDAQGRPTRRHLALIAWAYSPFPEVAGSLAREPYVNYGRMGQRELENFRVLLQDGVKRRRAIVARYQADAVRETHPDGRRVNLDLANRQRGPLAWHQGELGLLEAQQRRRGSRAKPMVLSSRGWIPSTPVLPFTTLRWDRLPDDVRSDGFLLASIHDGGLRRPQGSTVLVVKILPLAEVWPLFRAVFPGRDIGGNPAASDAEDHWDERGPAHAVTLMNLLEAVFPDPAKATPEDVMRAWMLEDRDITWETPEFDEDLDDAPWSGHSSMASTVQRIGPPHPGMLLPPLVVDADGFVDGRHRIYAARLAGLGYVPVLDLSQLEKR